MILSFWKNLLDGKVRPLLTRHRDNERGRELTWRVGRGSFTSGEIEREMVARGPRDGVAGAS